MPGRTIEDVVLRLSLQVMDAKIKVPEVERTKTAIKSVDDAVVRANERMGKAFDSVQQSVNEANAAITKASEARIKREEELFKATQRAEDAAFRAGDAYKQAGEGALTLARGVALAAAALDDDLGRALQRYVLPAQAALDIFKGTFEVTKGLREARKALTVTTTALAAAEGGLAAATTASNTAAVASLATVGKWVVRAGGLTAILGTAGTLLFQLKSAWDANTEAERRALELQDKHIEIAKRREQALDAQREALVRLNQEQRGRAQGEASQLLNLQLEAIRTLEPTQRRDALRQLDTGDAVNERAAAGIELLRRGGRFGAASQLADDRVQQLQNEATRLRELLATEREIAAEQKRQLLADRQNIFRQTEDRGFVDQFQRQRFGNETEAAVEQLQRAFDEREQAITAALHEILQRTVAATRQAQKVQRDAEVLAISPD